MEDRIQETELQLCNLQIEFSALSIIYMLKKIRKVQPSCDCTFHLNYFKT